MLRNGIVKNDQVQELLKQPISRQQFLKYLATAGLSIIGVNSLISAVLNSHKPLEHKKTSHGFGSSKFGV